MTKGHMSESSLEQGDRVAAEVARAPRVTLADVLANIKSEVSGRASDLFAGVPHSQELECLTICVITTQAGFTIVGTSACASPENFDAAVGHKFAKEDAVRKLWGFMGYELKSRLARASEQA